MTDTPLTDTTAHDLPRDAETQAEGTLDPSLSRAFDPAAIEPAWAARWPSTRA